MGYFGYKKIIAYSFCLIGILLLSQFSYVENAQAARTRHRTYDIQYQGVDSGRYRNSTNNELWNQINALSSQPAVLNLRIPVLFGVVVSDLEDTWGDARANGRTHEGIDIISPRGTLVVSPTDAIVTTVEDSGNGGKHVFTANPGGERYYFAHLDSFAQGLAEGQVLKPGDLIGYVGNTGNAAGGVTHLHFGIYQDDHNVTNPFPRLTLVFTLAEKMDAVTRALNSSADPTALSRALIAQDRASFTQAQASNIVLPISITNTLADRVLAVTLSITRTLRLGSQGEDVKALQVGLGITSDGAFGPKTKAAVIAFQVAKNLTPDGVFGPMSRVALASSSSANQAGCTSSTAYSPLTGIKCIKL